MRTLSLVVVLVAAAVVVPVVGSAGCFVESSPGPEGEGEEEGRGNEGAGNGEPWTAPDPCQDMTQYVEMRYRYQNTTRVATAVNFYHESLSCRFCLDFQGNPRWDYCKDRSLLPYGGEEVGAHQALSEVRRQCFGMKAPERCFTIRA